MAVITKAYERKLFDSCRVLFGPQVDVGWDFLFYIQISGVKTAFRQQALLTHPDRAALRGGGAAVSGSASFRTAKEAYDHLLEFLGNRAALRPSGKSSSRPAPQARRERPRPRGRRAERPAGAKEYYYGGNLPRRGLLLGEFLFYSGVISWENLIRAIVWQRRQRPRLGDIAIQRGWIEPWQARAVVRQKGLGVPIGEALVRRGLLNRGQVALLVWRQRHMQTALGEYFLSRGHVSAERLRHLLEEFGKHNRNHPSPAWRPTRDRQGKR